MGILVKGAEAMKAMADGEVLTLNFPHSDYSKYLKFYLKDGIIYRENDKGEVNQHSPTASFFNQFFLIPLFKN